MVVDYGNGYRAGVMDGPIETSSNSRNAVGQERTKSRQVKSNQVKESKGKEGRNPIRNRNSINHIGQ